MTGKTGRPTAEKKKGPFVQGETPANIYRRYRRVFECPREGAQEKPKVFWREIV